MSLNEFAARRRLEILAELTAGRPPTGGAYDEATFREGLAKGRPTPGATRYEPDQIVLEFVFPNPQGAPILLAVRVAAPERIVFLPVPEWVVESIWQGEIDGSYQFESDAERMLRAFERLLSPERNPWLFGERNRVGRG